MEASRLPQHLEALERANVIRLARAELKREIAAGTRTPAEIIRNPPQCAMNMQIADLLMAQRWWGRDRTRRFLHALGLPEQKRIGTLTPRQRFEVADLLSR